MPIVPEGETYIEWLSHYARATPAAPAMVYGDSRTDYAQLAARVDAVAAALAAMGVKSGDRVAQMGAPNPYFWTCLLATFQLGAIWVGINPRYTPNEVLHVIADCDPVVWLRPSRCDGETIEHVRRHAPALNIVDVERLCDGPADREFVPLNVDPAAAALIVYTSGTTGKPKGALLAHRSITRFCRAQAERAGLRHPSVVAFFPINHVSATLDVCGGMLAAGGTIVFLEQFDPGASLALMARERTTVWGGMPTTLQMQLEDPSFAATDLSSVALIAWGGAALPPDVLRRLQSICPSMSTNYGLTESASAITSLVPTTDPVRLRRSVGTALPGVEVRIVHPATHQMVKTGEEGEIQARSSLNMLSYWRNPEATAAAFTNDGFFKTGDLGRLDADGHLEICGRLREMYKSGGHNVYPREIELVIEGVDGVRMAAVVGVPDPLWQEVGVAFVAAPASLENAIVAACRASLANYKRPKAFILLDTLPLLANGKLDRVQLRERAINHVTT